MTEQQIQTKINAIAEQVAIAGKAVDSATEATGAGFDPRGVWNAAAGVIDNSVRELRLMQISELTRQNAEMVRNAKVTFYRP